MCYQVKTQPKYEKNNNYIATDYSKSMISKTIYYFVHKILQRFSYRFIGHFSPRLKNQIIYLFNDAL